MLSIYGYGIDGFIEYFKAALCSMVQCLIWVSFDERNKVNGKTVKMTMRQKRMRSTWYYFLALLFLGLQNFLFFISSFLVT